jgi:hypothetical protein
MKGRSEGTDRIDTLYLLGVRSRRLGRSADTRRYFDEVKSAVYTDEEGNTKSGDSCILERVTDREKLIGRPAKEKRAVDGGTIIRLR